MSSGWSARRWSGLSRGSCRGRCPSGPAPTAGPPTTRWSSRSTGNCGPSPRPSRSSSAPRSTWKPANAPWRPAPMDRRLLRYYERELRHLREVGAEFAREFPKIAGRIGLDEFACADPYVERLLEGFAFLTARVQLKIDAEFPRLTQNLLETVYPHYLAPTPSMAVVQFNPDPAEGALAEGVRIPRATMLRSLLGKDEQTPCQYQTAHD